MVFDLPMDIHRETRYAADPETVFAMLTDEAFLRRRAERSHALDWDASVKADGNMLTSVLRQSLPASFLPEVARKLTGETVELTEGITWSPPNPDRSRDGTISLDVTQAPVTLRGTIILSLSGAQTAQVVRAELKASIPLIGKKVEEAAAPAVILAVDTMQEISEDWLR